MAVKQWNIGDVLTAADMNSWTVPLPAYKTSSTSRTATALSLDPDLQLTLAANCYYEVRGAVLYQNATGASGFSWTWAVPSGAAGAYAAAYTAAGPTVGGYSYTWSATPGVGAASDNITHGIVVEGMIWTGASAGTFGLQWACTTASAGALAVLLGSKLIAERVG